MSKRINKDHLAPEDRLTQPETDQSTRRPGRPAGKTKKERVSFHLPSELARYLAGEAENQKIPKSHLLAMILMDYFAGRRLRSPSKKRTLEDYAAEKGIQI